MKNTNFDLLLSGVPYQVKVEPFAFNSEVRYAISYNDSPPFIFAWDEALQRFTSIGEETATIPDDIEDAIATRLLQITEERKQENA